MKQRKRRELKEALGIFDFLTVRVEQVQDLCRAVKDATQGKTTTEETLDRVYKLMAILEYEMLYLLNQVDALKKAEAKREKREEAHEVGSLDT